MFLKQLDTSELKEVFRAFPEVSHPLALHRHALMRGPSPFTAGERELIAAFTSMLNACSYCYDEHNAVAASFGLSGELLKALIEDIETAPVEPRLRPVFRYVRKLTQAPSRVVQADVDAMHAAVSALKEGGRFVTAGIKLAAGPLSPFVNAVSRALSRTAVTAPLSMSPWRALEQVLGELDVTELRWGTAYVAAGVKARRFS